MDCFLLHLPEDGNLIAESCSMVQAYVRLALNLCYVHMLAQVNDRENNGPYEYVLCPARMHFPYGLRTDHRRLEPQGQY